MAEKSTSSSKRAPRKPRRKVEAETTGRDADLDQAATEFDFEEMSRTAAFDEDVEPAKERSKTRTAKEPSPDESATTVVDAETGSEGRSGEDRNDEGRSDDGDGDAPKRRRRRRRRGRRDNDGEQQTSSEQQSTAPAGTSANRGSGGSGSGSGSGGGGGGRSGGGGGGGGGRGGSARRDHRDNRGGQGDGRRSGGGQRGRRGSGGGGGGGGRGQNARGGSQRPQSSAVSNEVIGEVEGVLELHPKGYGFLRSAANSYSSRETDPFVSSSLIEKYNLREGIKILGDVGPGTKGQGPRLKSITSIDGRDLEAYQQIRHFDTLTAVNPFEQLKLETGPTPITMRVMDLLTPIGKGQRALLVAPPRSGKTMLLQEIADSISANHPEVHLIVLLIDERPEEVTEMTRRVKGEVIASSMDQDVESHVRISQLIFERAKRLAESGEDVFVLLDSITRTARAFNKWVGNTGRTMSGGLDVKAMDIPKKMFGTARRFEEGGSLTVAGTALIETGSRMDDVIFQEFKGTGNMELVLNRDLADRRIWPAIDVGQSGTRREEKILSPDVMEGVTLLRRSLVSLSPVEAMEQLTKTLAKFPSNAEFLAKIRSVM